MLALQFVCPLLKRYLLEFKLYQQNKPAIEDKVILDEKPDGSENWSYGVTAVLQFSSRPALDGRLFGQADYALNEFSSVKRGQIYRVLSPVCDFLERTL